MFKEVECQYYFSTGIGYAMFLISFFIGIYYNMVVAWSFRYLFASMAAVLPWTSKSKSEKVNETNFNEMNDQHSCV
jgi:SNF family Na+-dependent transporter